MLWLALSFNRSMAIMTKKTLRKTINGNGWISWIWLVLTYPIQTINHKPRLHITCNKSGFKDEVIINANWNQNWNQEKSSLLLFITSSLNPLLLHHHSKQPPTSRLIITLNNKESSIIIYIYIYNIKHLQPCSLVGNSTRKEPIRPVTLLHNIMIHVVETTPGCLKKTRLVQVDRCPFLSSLTRRWGRKEDRIPYGKKTHPNQSSNQQL